MNSNLKKNLETLLPFLMLGIAIALMIGLFIMFSYVLVWGLMIGGVLWIVSFITSYFFPSKQEPAKPVKSQKGRVIDHDEKH